MTSLPPDMFLREFVRESNRIEGILREPREAEIAAHVELLALDVLTVEALEKFVSACEAAAYLRVHDGDNVRVGSHFPPRGGPAIRAHLEALLCGPANHRDSSAKAFAVHKEYEWLHPFIDGNGRSGRALWLWMMGGRAPSIGFLHTWYYQSLNASHGADR